MDSRAIETSHNNYLIVRKQDGRDLSVQLVDWDSSPLSPERRFNAQELINVIKVVTGLEFS